MNYIYGVFYLKRVCIILSHAKWLSPFVKLVTHLQEAGIACEAMLTEEEYPVLPEMLYVTDSEAVVKKLVAEQLPVAVYLHEENRGQDLSAAKYAFESPEGLDATYMERVYRRYKGIPWDILETGRCYLRETMVEDVDDFYEIYREPEITRYTDALYESKISERAYVREYIEKVYKYFEFGIWTVVLKETGQIIGRAGLNIREGYEWPELGYVIGLPWQGQGIATEVCRRILEVAWTEYGLEHLITIIQKENIASLRVAQELGFCEKERIWMNNKEYLLLYIENLQM